MHLVVAYNDIKPEQIIHNKGNGADKPAAKVYPFFWAAKDRLNDPTAFLVRYELGTSSSTHYHAADQMQVVVEGKGVLGHHHELGPYHVHFARAYTPYGPLVPDKTEGWGFITLRARADPEGAQRLSVAREKLAQVPNRHPWQITRPVGFPQLDGQSLVGAPIDGLSNDDGLFGIALRMAPGATTVTPDASGGDGQYVLALKGSFVHAGKECKALSVVFIRPHEDRFEIKAGPDGLEALVLNFPKVGTTQSSRAKGNGGALRTLQCILCGFVYNEKNGIPDDGIAPGTRWEDVPEDWTCSDCGAAKKDFEMAEI